MFCCCWCCLNCCFCCCCCCSNWCCFKCFCCCCSVVFALIAVVLGVFCLILLLYFQKGLEVCYYLRGYHPDPRLGPILGPSRSHPGPEGVPSRFAMCFRFAMWLVLQHFRPIQVPRWGHPGPSCSRAPRVGPGRAETDFLATSEFCCYAAKQARGREREHIEGGGQNAEQLPGKIQGGNYVSKCEH